MQAIMRLTECSKCFNHSLTAPGGNPAMNGTDGESLPRRA
jgi:hypothetical protein